MTIAFAGFKITKYVNVRQIDRYEVSRYFMLTTITDSGLWKSSLGITAHGEALAALERIRHTFFQFRDRTAVLVAEIHRHLPELTVHDISHLDSLWEVGSLIAGPKFELTPTEGFVFGGAVLLHDAGMALASHVDGLADLKKRPEWSDAVAVEFEKEFGRKPIAKETNSPPDSVKNSVVALLLRNLHAQQAERLAITQWKAENSNPQFLIEDSELRQSFGRIIGMIAHSHWWPIHKVEREFSRTLGAPHWCPHNWTIDPLKIACLLRVADVSHIDARRAPSLLRALRQPCASSDVHWKFQEKLQKPTIVEDALVYTSGYAFPFSDASAWWLCLDTLTYIDRELKQVDALLADKHQPRFSARRVAGVESPERIVSFIPTDGWLPMDAQVQVSDVPKLVKKLGGAELYGKHLSVGIRELIQNATDAVKARRVTESRPDNWGSVCVRLGKDHNGEWLEVEDNGIGMSDAVLRRYLLDFGNSYWGSSLMLDEFPGLLAKGMKPVGKYGIGFFSIFMLGSAVRVRTRRADAAQRSTLILEFNTGLTVRPVIREAEESEFLKEGGTTVRVWLDTPSKKTDGLLSRKASKPTTLADFCLRLCPSLDVSLTTSEFGKDRECIGAGDWTECEPTTLIKRLPYHGREEKPSDSVVKLVAKNLKIIKNTNGAIVGRACIAIDRNERGFPGGVVTVGGLKACYLYGVAGVFEGSSKRASRDAAVPVAEPQALAKWATEQAILIYDRISSKAQQMECAAYVRRFGGVTKKLPICRFDDQWWSYGKLAKAKNIPSVVVLVDDMTIRQLEAIPGFEIGANVIVTESNNWMSISVDNADHEWPSWPDNLFLAKNDDRSSRPVEQNTLGHLVINALSSAWNIKASKIFPKEDAKYTKVRVGTVNGQTVMNRGIVIRKARR